MTKILIILSLVFSPMSYAQTIPFIISSDGCSQVKPIDKGQPAPCDGYFFPEEDMNQAQADRLQATYLGEINTLLVQKSELEGKENEILQRRLELYQKQANTLSEDVARRESNESLYRIGYFALGAVITGFIAANVRK